MAHNEARGSVWKEAALGLLTGSIYGGTHTISGHPLDTIKSRMQLQTDYHGLSMTQSIKKLARDEGFRGFFRGCIPPLWGSMFYRGIMVSSFEYSFTWFEQNTAKDSIFQYETSFGLRPLVPISSVFSALCRGIFENPIEYAKVMGQTGQKWNTKDVFRGFNFQVARTTGLLIPIFTICDCFRRKTDVMKTLYGNFLVTAGASSFSYLLCWPLETFKNLTQAGVPHAGATVAEKLKFLGGPRGLYRGVLPGVIAGGVRNGAAMVAMVYAQSLTTKLGLRET